MDENKRKKYIEEITPFLLDGEEIEDIYGLIVDYALITNKRILFVDKELTSSGVSVVTLPFSKINSIAISKSGKLLSATNSIHIFTKGKPFELRFIKGEKIVTFYKKIAAHICNF